MASASRAWIVKRRQSNVADYSALSVTSGSLTADELERRGLLSLNSKIEIGIATETEVGLSEDRYPVFCRIVNEGDDDPPTDVDTVVHYWPVVDAAGNHVPYSRRPDFEPRVINRIYEWVPEFDDEVFRHNDLMDALATRPSSVFALDTAHNAQMDIFYNHASLPVPSDVQKAAGITALKAVLNEFVAARQYVYVKVADGRFIHCIPHGTMRTSTDPANMSVDQMLIKEWMLTVLVNSKLMRMRHPNATEGVITAAAYAVANNARYGLYEAYEHKELAFMTFTQKSNHEFEVHEVHKPEALDVGPAFAEGQTVDISQVRIERQLIEVANGLNTCSGIMHYVYNHTTGGAQMSGPLLSVAMLYKVFDDQDYTCSSEVQTSIYYEALHNTNKRMIANLIIDKSKVTTYGRSRMCNKLQPLKLDTFMNLRRNAYPAGSHKAYICLIVLKKVLASFFGVFLPWASEINNVINICREVMTNGARSHVGSAYYTGMPAIAQGAELDAYIPELACYMNVMARNDTLTMSPHLAPDIAARAAQSWSAMLNKIKSEDISSTDPAIVKKFLETVGHVQFNFDPQDPMSWAEAATECHNGVKTINDLLSNL